MIIQNLPFIDYLAIEAVSNSRLKHMADSPFHCYQNCLNPERPDEVRTVSQTKGSATHTYVLEKEKFDSLFVVAPDGYDLRTKNGKEWKSNNTDRAVVRHNEFLQVKGMREAVMSISKAAMLINSPRAQKEVTLTWIDEETGLACKARPDVMIETDGKVILLDLKTTEDVEKFKFKRSVIKYGYDTQQAMYGDGVRANGLIVSAFIFIPVSSSWPFVSCMYTLPVGMEDKGYYKYRERMLKYKACADLNSWPAFGQEIIELPEDYSDE